MAEAWTRHLKGEVIDVYSAGIETHGLNPNAVKVMAEVGVDMSAQQSQNVDEFVELEFDYVVAVCGHANESRPVFAGEAKVVFEGFDDPPKMAANLHEEEQKLDCYRQVRDQIKDYVLGLPEVLEG